MYCREILFTNIAFLNVTNLEKNDRIFFVPIAKKNLYHHFTTKQKMLETNITYYEKVYH
jgi:hypothetical protein